VVHKELKDRGLAKLEKMQNKWIKENWQGYVAEKMPSSTRKVRRKRRIIIKWI
jgi:hypothetical protein